MRVRLRSEAQDDLLEGAWFYEKQRDGLGEHFIDCIESDLAILAVNHGFHEFTYGFQRKLVERFPFAIYYVVTETHVDVAAILDCRRNPSDTAERLGKTRSDEPNIGS